MSINVYYIADPPQWARLRTVSAINTPYLVGDRITAFQSTPSVGIWTYRCTTAGTSPGTSFTPAGAATYNWGTSVWTLITPSSWADAATPLKLRSQYLNYIDCNIEANVWDGTAFGAATSEPSIPVAAVFVEPSTMKPTPPRPALAGANQMPLFFGNLNSGGYHGRVKFGFNPVAFNTGSFLIDTAGNCTTFAGNGNAGWRGVDLTVTNVQTAQFMNMGVATKITYLADNAISSYSPSSLRGENTSEAFGLHVEHQTAGAMNAAPTYPTQAQLLFGHPHAWRSDNSTPVLPAAHGSFGGLLRSTVVYRTGVASAPDIDHSFQVDGVDMAGYATLITTPFIFIHNTLTGARTLTLHMLTDSPFASADLYNDEIWLEVFYPSSATGAVYGLATTENVNWGVPACSKTLVASDAAAWTYSGIFEPVAFKLVLSFSPQRAGMLLARVNIASKKLSYYNNYLCPFVDIA